MKKYFSSIFFYILLLSSVAYADIEFYKGSYISWRPGVGGPELNPTGILDLYDFGVSSTLNACGKARGSCLWSQSGALFYPLNFGTNSVSFGNYKQKGDYLYLTFWDYDASPAELDGIHDITLSSFVKTDQLIEIIDKNTLKVIRRVLTSYDDIGVNPLTAQGTVILDSKTHFYLHKIKVDEIAP